MNAFVAWTSNLPNGMLKAKFLPAELCCSRAEIADGQEILELGCGWGSLCLYAAAKYPRSRVTAVSNSRTQKKFIDNLCELRGIGNLRVETADVVSYEADRKFDRVLSVEMFEHMKNYKVSVGSALDSNTERKLCSRPSHTQDAGAERYYSERIITLQALLAKIAGWMKPGGLLFVHLFTHRLYAYHFEVRGLIQTLLYSRLMQRLGLSATAVVLRWCRMRMRMTGWPSTFSLAAPCPQQTFCTSFRHALLSNALDFSRLVGL